MKKASRKLRSRPQPPSRTPGGAEEVRQGSAAPSPVILGLIVALLAVAVYLPGLTNGFAYDAVVLVEEDARVHSLSQPWDLVAGSYWPMGRETLALYRPLVTLSYAVDWALYDGAPWGFHLTNALLHCGTSVLVFLLLAGLTSPLAALAGASLFALHPVQVEAVASIVGRGDILALAFMLGALLAWIRLPARGTALIPVVGGLFLLGLASKESAIMLPLILVLFDAASGRLRRGGVGDWVKERWAAFLALGLVAVGYLIARAAVLGALTPESVNPIMAVTPPGATRIRTAFAVWTEILRLLAFPVQLLSDYSPRIVMPAESWTLRAVAGLLLVGGLVVGGVVALLRGRGTLGIVLLWTPIALLPVSNFLIPIGVLLAERTLYVAVFALALGVALVVERIRGNRLQLRTALALTAVVCVLFFARTVLRLPSWDSTDQVFRTLMRNRPDSYRAHWHFARMAWRDGDLNAALDYYRSTIALWPYAQPVYLEAGMFATETGMEQEARAFAELALRNWPEDPIFLRRLAVAAINLNDTAAALAAVERGLRVEPDDPLFRGMKEALGGSPPR